MSSFLAFAGSSVGFAVSACCVVLIAWLVLRWSGSRYARPVHDLLFLLSVVTILVMTLRPGSLGGFGSRWQLIPMEDLILALPMGMTAVRLAIADLVGNVILFAPLGASIALRWPKASMRRVVLGAALFSAAIELTQGVTDVGRMAQSSDVIMDATGAWLGWILAWRILRLRAAPASDVSVAVPRHR
jgi:glycopeptide antibiotics resistance protein